MFSTLCYDSFYSVIVYLGMTELYCISILNKSIQNKLEFIIKNNKYNIDNLNINKCFCYSYNNDIAMESLIWLKKNLLLNL
jgi:thiamine pyrophosphokinase